MKKIERNFGVKVKKNEKILRTIVILKKKKKKLKTILTVDYDKNSRRNFYC